MCRSFCLGLTDAVKREKEKKVDFTINHYNQMFRQSDKGIAKYLNSDYQKITKVGS